MSKGKKPEQKRKQTSNPHEQHVHVTCFFLHNSVDEATRPHEYHILKPCHLPTLINALTLTILLPNLCSSLVALFTCKIETHIFNFVLLNKHLNKKLIPA